MKILERLENEKQQLPAKYQGLSREEMEQRVRAIKVQLGDKLFIPGHHYQKDEVIQFADAVGDSLQLAQIAEQNTKAEYVVFCGVHFMAETADILTEEHQKVVLPDMRAGCSMADMANITQTERGWAKLQQLFDDTLIPLTYVNSTAEIKSFVGQHGGATVTSSNAAKVVSWALNQKERILFLPDQHLGRNTAYELGISLEQMAVWNPITEQLEYDELVPLHNIKIILWKGHCSVHENFTIENISFTRTNYPNMKIIVHPECKREVVALSDMNGSTKKIIDTIEQAPAGSEWAIGTEMNLVNRLIQQHTDKKIVSLNPYMCPCLTMNRIDLEHLLWSLESIFEGKPRNVIKVNSETNHFAKIALKRMLTI